MDKEYSRCRMRLCFASPSHEEIRGGIALLADICRKEARVLLTLDLDFADIRTYLPDVIQESSYSAHTYKTKST